MDDIFTDLTPDDGTEPDPESTDPKLDASPKATDPEPLGGPWPAPAPGVVRVVAKAAVAGLALGELGELVDDDKTRALIAVGFLERA